MEFLRDLFWAHFKFEYFCKQVGDQVVALPEYRAWAELVSVPAQYVYALPEGMTALDAVAVTTNYVVAYLLLFEMANLTPGKSLLVHSAGGGVVSYCYIQYLLRSL